MMKHTEIAELARIRLERDWTYAQLALAVGLKEPTVYRLLTTKDPNVHERTMFKIRRFLAAFASRPAKQGAAA